MAIRVGRWDCFVCGNVGILGPETHCTDCGSSRPKDVVFYLPEDAKVVKDKEELAKAKAGADWVCSYCNGHNKTDAIVCSTCGNDKSEKEDEALEVRELTLDEVPNSGARGISRSKETPKKLDKKAGFWKYILGASGLGGVFWWLFAFSTVIQVPVVEMYWERQIEVLEYKQVQEEEWELPSEATNTESFQAIHHYRKDIIGYNTETRTVQKKVGTRRVVCGQKDQGNGYFEDIYCNEPIYENVQEEYEAPIYKETPIYKTKYRYNIYRWLPNQPLMASGSNERVNWPTVPAEITGNPKKFKTGKQDEKYLFWIKTHKDEKVKYDVKDVDTFTKLYVGKKLDAEKSTVFGTYKGLKSELFK
jgi:hypothetical protein